MSNAAVGGESCCIFTAYFSLVALNVFRHEPLARSKLSGLLFNASPCWTSNAHPASSSTGPEEALCRCIANISSGTHKFHFPFICGHQMVNHHFCQSAEWQWHCCWLSILRIFRRDSAVNAVHFIFCHIEVFGSVVLLSKFHLFSWNSSLLLFILILAFTSCSSCIALLSMSFKAKQKRRVYLLELFTSAEQENFLLCSQRQYKLSEKVTITREKT